MKKTDIENFLKPLNKKDLKTVLTLAEKQLNSSELAIGDSVTLTIEYMIGDSNGDTEEEYSFKIKSQADLDALDVITDILDNHTKPNKGSWGFSLDSSDFSKKSEDVYNILYNQEDAPKEYNGIKLTPKVLDRITDIVDSVFRGEAEYSFLVYQGYEIVQ